jgi:hypothetical protein
VQAQRDSASGNEFFAHKLAKVLRITCNLKDLGRDVSEKEEV